MVSKPSRHAAGIFADMALDGPVIGTLVAVFDRAKNMPNRKTLGKQNPYCAARLGKEAKKTNTDFRGGQTPRWDQELRFTVHESPDYLQLKVSVFNDDKRTDLIGETWVDLKAVIVPGGGQSDQWHHLQCKGKYAGEIRMELTFYDTRPQDEAVIERRKEAERAAEAKAEARLAAGRPSKAPKRRPLPADPTGGSGALPAAPKERKIIGPRSDEPHQEPPPPARQQQHAAPAYDAPEDMHRQWDAPQHHHPRPTNAVVQAPPRHEPYHPDPRDVYQHHQGVPAPASYPDPYPRQIPMPMPHEYSHPPPPPTRYERTPVHSMPLEHQDPYYPPEEHAAYTRGHPETARPNSHSPHYNPPPPPEQEYGAPVLYQPHRGYSDPHIPHQQDPRAAPAQEYHHPHHNSVDSSRDRPPRHSNSNELHPHPEYVHAPFHDEPDEDGPPPPPPVHRQGVHVHQPPPQRFIDRPSESVPMPEPLNISPGRVSPNTHQPQQYTAYSSPGHPPPDHGHHSTSPVPSYHSYRNDRPYSRDRQAPFNPEPVPSPIPTRYSGPTVADESEEMTTDYRPDYRQYHAPAQQALPPVQPSQPLRVSAGPVERPTSSSRSGPDLRHVPPRKSVSPQPPPAAADMDTLQGIPFSPDSFDALNPNVSRASAIQQPNAAYSSPAEAAEAARQFEVDKLRALGPIVGNDGRVIDPSDHLPADTWAPEPERKSRKPEVVVRFKHANAKGPRPAPRDTPQSTPPRAQPLITSQPVTPSQPSPSTQMVAISPSSERAGRNRLQKARPQSYIQPSPSTTPLRERDNIGSLTTVSPSYSSMSRHWPPDVPPIPAKVPIQAGSQNYPVNAPGGAAGGGGGDMLALSEEMKRIDIGAGTLTRRGRNSYAGGY